MTTGDQGSRLEVRAVRFAYGAREVLGGIDFAFECGEFVSLLGANGAGKSTLLRVMLGLVRPTAGAVLLNGEPIARLSRRVMSRHLAYVPQTHVSPFPYTVREVVMMGRLGETGMMKSPSANDESLVDDAIARLGIVHLAARPYTEISGGERQLTLLTRALAQGARLLILDEPASALDFGHQHRLMTHLMALVDDGYGVFMSTHHPDQALMAATRAILLKDGRVMADGAPQDCLDGEAIWRLYGVRVAGTGRLAPTPFRPLRETT